MHPIIALWSHPRSMSTATERVMRERGDLECLHEPFLYYYYVERGVRDFPHFDGAEDHPTSYDDIRAMLLEKAERGPVFFKDMSFYAMPRILDDADFCERLTNCFLIRNPEASIASYFKLDPDMILEEIGIEAQWRHLQALEERRPGTTTVIEAEAVRNDPEGTMGAFWARIGLPFVADAFDWNTDEAPDDWSNVQAWHTDTQTSGGIRPMAPDAARREREKFEALAAEHPHLTGYLDHHRPFYEHLKSRALAPGRAP